MIRLGVTGHQEVPSGVDRLLQAEIRGLVESRSPASGFIGVTSLAAGTDQLFADVILELGGSLHVVLPCLGYETTFSDSKTLDHFEDLLGHAEEVEKLTFPSPREEAFLAAGKRVVDLSDILLAVWDGKPARGLGGTADIVNYAGSVGRPIRVLWPTGASR
ncbi:MAG: hypothetical protein GEU71_00400 [Actinobacteria bacterium]|nr:hypothetical protein [Actinomycetota bacterium]